MSLGDLERAAGVTDRAAFWRPFASRPHGFVAGRDELHRMAGIPVPYDMLSREAGLPEPKRKKPSGQKLERVGQ